MAMETRMRRERQEWFGIAALWSAGEAVAEQIAEPGADGKFKVNAKGVEELGGRRSFPPTGKGLVAIAASSC
jgi:hypothetical protein